MNTSLSPEQKTPLSVSWGIFAFLAIPLICTPDINSELDELDREEFYRLKKVAGKKQRDTAVADAEMKAKKEAQKEQENVKPEEDTGPSDILAETEDDDVIF